MVVLSPVEVFIDLFMIRLPGIIVHSWSMWIRLPKLHRNRQDRNRLLRICH